MSRGRQAEYLKIAFFSFCREWKLSIVYFLPTVCWDSWSAADTFTTKWDPGWKLRAIWQPTSAEWYFVLVAEFGRSIFPSAAVGICKLSQEAMTAHLSMTRVLYWSYRSALLVTYSCFILGIIITDIWNGVFLFSQNNATLSKIDFLASTLIPFLNELYRSSEFHKP